MAQITFTIEYFTSLGESVVVSIHTIEEHGTSSSILPLTTTEGGIWKGSSNVLIESPEAQIIYRYVVVKSGVIVRQEMEKCPHSCHIKTGVKYIFEDTWRDLHHRSFLYSTAFKDCICAAQIHSSRGLDSKSTLRFLVQGLLLPKGKRLAVVGSGLQLGRWNVERALLMDRVATYDYERSIDVDEFDDCLEYKYLILDENTTGNEIWENGENRIVSLHRGNESFLISRGDVARFEDYNLRIAGTVVPLFSLRSKSSYGVGDFADLAMMINWIASTGMNLVQLLPINDTTRTGSWSDSYPYNSISIFAIHPMYISLKWLGETGSEIETEESEEERKAVNALPQVDYERANTLKLRCLRLYVEKEGKGISEQKDYQHFVENNKQWLLPYSAFCCLRDRFKSADFRHWGQYAVYSEEMIINLLIDKAFRRNFDFYCIVQYIAFEQIKRVRSYARSNGVVLKGDIPIGISRDSVPAWVDTELFNFDMQAGAPPDGFAQEGQNWGFPTYNWKRMMKDNCRWWKNRLIKMSEYCDAYRVDHILGFFRIWEIPYEQINGTMGHFFPSKPITENELNGFGLEFNAADFIEPYITDRYLQELFGDLEAEAKNYLHKGDDGRWKPKPEYDTQRKIDTHFQHLHDETSRRLCKLLFRVLEQVLFFVEPSDSLLLHPNIAGHTTTSYSVLANNEKKAYSKLYEEYFYHRHNEFWQKEAMLKLPALTQATDMLACAEDLGMIPDGVAKVLNDLQILSLEVQRMPKRHVETFAATGEYDYMSVCTISTHDMAPLRKWWAENEKLRIPYAKNFLRSEIPLEKEMPAYLCEQAINDHLASPSMICALALQDWLAIDEKARYTNAMEEQINDPSNPNQYWRYRMHLTIEELVECGSLNNKIFDLIKKNGRGS